MNIQYWFTLFAVSQGAAVLGLTVFIFSYYIPKNKTQTKSNMRWHVVSVSLSYILLTGATIKTAIYQYYNWGDLWYWLVTIAYISGDISLIYVFRNSVKNHHIKKINKEN